LKGWKKEALTLFFLQPFFAMWQYALLIE